MKSHRKRVISLLVTLCMLFGLLPQPPAKAAGTITVRNEQELRNAVTGTSYTEITLDGEITLTQMLNLNSNADIVIQGGSIVQSGQLWNDMGESSGGNWCMFNVQSGSITLKNTLINGKGKTQIMNVGNASRVEISGSQIQNGSLKNTGYSAGVSVRNRTDGGQASIIIDNSTFSGNSATKNSPTNGGALYVGNGWKAEITNTTFENNTAHSGGAMYVYRGSAQVANSVKFVNNEAGQRGGAIHSHGDVVVNGTGDATQFVGNTSGQFGGTFYCSANEEAGRKNIGRIVLDNVHVEGSTAGTAGGAAYIASMAELYVKGDTVLQNNQIVSDDGNYNNNVMVSSSTGRLIVYGDVTSADASIGVSTSNPRTHLDLVYSSTEALNLGGYTVPQYQMSSKAENYKKFDYDAEVWTLEKDTTNPDRMWLNVVGATDSRVIFDYNLPGMVAEKHENLTIGSTVPTPKVSAQTQSDVTYTFLGWYDAATGGTKQGATVPAVAGTSIYYAQWAAKATGGGGAGAEGKGDMYLIYFDQNYDGGGFTAAYSAAGTFTVTVETTDDEGNDVTEEYEVKLPFAFPDDPYRPGYTFAGWGETAQSTTPIGGTWQPNKTDTLYGIWIADTHTLTWDANGGTGGTTTQQDFDQVIVPPTTEPTRAGYTFAGWYMDPNCTVPLSSSSVVRQDQTFFAAWTSEKVIVTYYDTREGSAVVGTQEYHYGDALTPLGPMADTSGQIFVRWETEDGQEATGIGNLTDAVLTYHKGANGGNVSSDAGYWGLDFYAVWAEQTTDYIATIRWNDLQNNDGCRPQSVHLGLISSVNNRLVAEATVADDGADTQTHTFPGLPITTADSSVEKITYSVFMLGYTDADGTYREIKDTSAGSGEIVGSTASKYDDAVSTTYRYAINNYTTGAAAAAYSGAIYLDHNLITTDEDIKFSIQWEDESDNDGKRPSAVTLVLYADGVAVQNQPLHNSGTGVVSASPSVCDVSDDGDIWTYIWKDYQKYNNGAAIRYTTAVTNNDQQTKFNSNGYATQYLNSVNEAVGDENGAIITRAVELVDKTVTVRWDDESNRDKLRPETVTVTLTAYQWNNKTYRWEDKLVGTVDITGGADNDTWTHTFPQVRRYNGGQEIIYRAAITSDLNAHIPEGANGYTATSNELNIVASHNRNVKSLPVKIEWDDAQNNDKIRPSTVIVQLYADGVKLDGADYAVLLNGESTADTWEYTFNNLPIYRTGAEGEEILYTISVEEAVEDSLYGTYISTANGQEEEITRYIASYMNAAGETTENLADSAYPYAKLTHGTDQGTINIYASWHDEQNRDGKRPSSIQVDLYKQVDGDKQFVKTYTVTAGRDNSWTYKVSGLPLHKNGHEVKYLADLSDDFRQNLQDTYGYTVSMEGPTVHLYYTPNVGYVTGHINWSDNNDNDNLRPDSITGTLYANGKSTGQTLAFNVDNGWTQTWQDVASYYNDNGTPGTPVVYTIQVATPDGYTVTYTPASTTTVDPHDIQIEMTHETDQQALTATVYWDDNRDQDGKRPDKVSIQLYANGQKVVGKTADVTGAGDTWTTQFTDLDKYANGQPIDYTIAVDDNTANTYTSLTAGMNLYLSYNSARADMTVAFRFDDGSDADGVRPDALYLRLTADGVEVDSADYERTVYFDTDGVKWTFQNLPVYSTAGTKIKYNATVTLDPAYGSTEYQVTTSSDVQLSTGGNTNQVIVSLKKDTETGTETGHIYWFDANNQRGNRPESLTVVVRSDASTAVVGTYTINSATGKVTNSAGNEVGTVQVSEWGSDGSSCWTYTIDGLTQNAVYDGGVSHEIFYMATANTTGVTSWYTVSDGISLDVALTHKHYLDDVGSSQQNFKATVSWMDNENAWNYRPNTNGVDITIYANGTAYKTVHLTQSDVAPENPNAWSYTFEGLPTYLNGSAVVWTAGIGDVTKFTPTVSSHNDYATITMTQSIGFDFTVRWSDSDNDDAARPDNVTVEVYGDGTKLGETTLTGDGSNIWTGAIADLPVWRESGTTVPVSYSFRWSDTTGAALIDNCYTATATNGGAAVETEAFYYLSATEWGALDGGVDDLTGQYQWETTLTRNKETKTVYAEILWADDANRDGLRPEAVQVQLYANGSPVGAPSPLTGKSTDSSWPVSWPDMDIYEGGAPIDYSAAVVTVPDGYAAEIDEIGTQITLTHVPDTADVTGKIIWDDTSEAHYEYNSLGDLVRSYYGIARTDVYMQLLVNGVPQGESIKIPVSGYEQEDGSTATTAEYKWSGVFVHADEGKANAYTIQVYSDLLDALLQDGHTLTYNFDDAFAPTATVRHTYYDVRGTVYYLYNSSDEFKLANVPVTAYLYDEQTKDYTAVGSAVTDANGAYEIKNIPQGMLTVRATYDSNGYTYAGSKGIKLQLCDKDGVDIIVNRDATADSDLYRYNATGHAYYQTDKTDSSTKQPVPEGSVVLLYQITGSGTQYVGMTATDSTGAYRFEKLASGQYLVNVAFNYDGGTYTYDNTDAQAAGLTFLVSGANAAWPDIVKQVNATVDPGPIDPPVDPVDPPTEPEPCVVDGAVYYADNGVHTTDPVAGADVYIYAAAGNAQLGHVMTDNNGQWQLEGLGAGNYIAIFALAGNTSRVLHFTVSAEDYAAGTYTAATQYFDRASDMHTATIRGVVLDDQSNQTSALVQILSGDSDDIVDAAYTDKNGAYTFTVQAGYTYRVRIVAVDKTTEYVTAGDPDDKRTTLDYYTVSGNYAIDGVAQAGATVALYKLADAATGTFEPVTATLTNDSGDYMFKVTDAGGYRITMYRDGQVYDNHMVTVDYKDKPAVIQNGDTYTISGASGAGDFDKAELYETTTKVVKKVGEIGAAQQYRFDQLPAGTYVLELTKAGIKQIYYADAPDSTIDVHYYVTVSGRVTDNTGKPVLGATVTLRDSKGEQVGKQTIITDGSYTYAGLPADTYQVQIDYPVAGAELVNKTTRDADSYGASYPDGMTPGSVWSWNLNAVTVSGTVSDQKGAPIEGATVVLKLNSDPAKAYGVTTDQDGRWSMGLMNGDYTASAMTEIDAGHIYHAAADVPISVAGTDVSGIALTINRYIVSGSVVRDGDGSALAGADITIAYPDGTPVWTGTSDQDGKFTAALFPDDYRVRVTANAGSETATADIKLDRDKELTLAVGMAIMITGTVYDVDGQVVPDGIVYYEGAQSGKAGKVHTNEQGKYQIGIAASHMGSYTLYATAAGNSSDKVTVDVQTDVEQDLILKQSSGGDGPAPAPGDRIITGIVVDNMGTRLANADVTLVYGNDKTKTVTTSSSNSGAYRFTGLSDGTYYLTAAYEAPNGYTYETNGQSTVHVNGADVADIVLAVRLSYDVTVTVKDTDGAAIAGATVSYFGASAGEVQTDDNGMVSLQLAGGSYDFAATIGNRESGKQTVMIDKATDVELIVGTTGIEYEPPTVESHDNTISGYVKDKDGNAVDGAEVTLHKFNVATEEWDVVDTTTTGSDGYYEFAGLEDGRYRIETSFTQSETVSTEAGSYQITGYAKDEGDNPYVGATVNLYDTENTLIATVYTTETGYYEFLDLTPGEYTVEIIPANDEGAHTTKETVTVEPGSAVIEGTAQDANGNPVAGATVTVSGDGGDWSMTTGEDGHYRIEVPNEGDYTVTITYPANYEVTTDGSYENDPADPIKPTLNADSFTISGYVHNTDGKPIDGATVILKDKDGTDLHRTTTNSDGYYEFTDLASGEYQVIVISGDSQQNYDVDTDNAGGGQDPGGDDKPDTHHILLDGVVVTDHKKPLAGAALTIRNMDTDEINVFATDTDGRFDTGALDKGRYELIAAYVHDHGENQSAPLYTSTTQNNVVLVITLSYVTDINGRDETVFAGQDDTFDTPDDFYQHDTDGDGVKEDIFVGEDKTPGSPDDWYAKDVDKDGEDEKVFVGDDCLPGTEDDNYFADPDKDGEDEKIFAGEDKKSGTEDDYYYTDVNQDGKDEQVFVGPDTIPGTDDDWYYDADGNKVPVGQVYINFDANGGLVNGLAIYKVLQSELQALPTPTREGYTFAGWYTAAATGTKLQLADMTALTVTTTVYAHWTQHSGGGSGGGGGGGGGSIGGGGATGGDPAPDVPTPSTPDMLTDKHIAYVSGYPDGTVQPDAQITRAEVAMIFYRLLTDEAQQYETADAKFSDVAAGSWYTAAIATLTNAGILSGYSDGTFRPDAQITRAEFATIAARFDSADIADNAPLSDLGGHWARKYIDRAYARGWVHGYSDGTFRPDVSITRAEAMTLINNVLGRSQITVAGLIDGMVQWPDNMDTGKWYYLAVQEATNGHDYVFAADGTESWTALSK